MIVFPWKTKQRFILQSQRFNTWSNLLSPVKVLIIIYVAGGMPVETRASCQGFFWGEAVCRHVPRYQSWVLSKLGHCLKI